MSRYLEEAAEQLRKATTQYEQNCTTSALAKQELAKNRERIAKGFATLAAIDKGLLPADITEDVLRAITRDHS